jgi:hypothetical protein
MGKTIVVLGLLLSTILEISVASASAPMAKTPIEQIQDWYTMVKTLLNMTCVAPTLVAVFLPTVHRSCVVHF